MFKQGPSARVRLICFVVASLALFIFDANYGATKTFRQIVGSGLYPLQQLAAMPISLGRDMLDYAKQVTTLQTENAELQKQRLLDKEKLHRFRTLNAENKKLRHLLKIANTLQVNKTIIVEVISDTSDPFSRKVIINKGSMHGVKVGMPVIDELGLQGQVTLAYAARAEVSLITDKDQIIPVEVLRNGFRTIMHGGMPGGQLELRFASATADIQENDLLVTSGLDDLYPRGIPVARIVNITKSSGSNFFEVLCNPVAGVEKHRFLLVLETSNPNFEKPTQEPETEETTKDTLKNLEAQAPAETENKTESHANEKETAQ